MVFSLISFNFLCEHIRFRDGDLLFVPEMHLFDKRRESLSEIDIFQE